MSEEGRKSLPWIIGTALAAAYFAVFEWLAFRYPGRFNTLSRAIWLLSAVKLVVFAMGIFVGGLATHFWWHWCPEVGAGIGLLTP